MMGVAVLGATGSIGRSTLEVLALHPERFRVVALAARRDVAGLAAQCLRFRPAWAALEDPAAAAELRQQLRAAGLATEVLAGKDAITGLASLDAVHTVMAAIAGAAGLPSTLAAARAGKRLLLANKESAVMAGELLMRALRASGGTLIPIDSEHNAIFQCLPASQLAGQAAAGVRRLLLTASGGPFLGWTAAAIATATPEQACAHPRWHMGRKISVDSATLMNKGLEQIEASVLFGLPGRAIEVLVHPQSIVHSLVEYEDGSVLAQLSSPDMRTPIAQALAWPGRIASGVEFLDLVRTGPLDFQAPDRARFPCLPLAEAALVAGGLAAVALNAADEVAVEAFLAGQLNFGDIAAVIDTVMNKAQNGVMSGLDAVLAADAEARALALAATRARAMAAA
ncbi:MAG TPA: 1-deoxy-D-xylulose-5-phosphate reductoisomerase [Steroidobacteraceae bacterium]|nr:1-deoxy-D-xylulose-5-phosphate reductoisomerase [Steroidobacteraceae bacterium]